jgi:hypothetical protein
LEKSEKSAIEAESLDPWSLYIYAMKAPMTSYRYKTRLAKFFDFIALEMGLNELDYRARMFAQMVQYQKDRADRKEITAATIRNYIKSIKLFCEMADIPIPWKKITREGGNMQMIEFPH